MRIFSRSAIAIGLSTIFGLTGCSTTLGSDPAALVHEQQANALTTEQQQQIEREREAQNQVINALEGFVHSNLYTGMIQVWSYDRRSWNQLLSVHACHPDNSAEILAETYQTNQPIFSEVMLTLAQNNSELSEDEQKILQDVSQLAYRLFSASYAQGYARQVTLADDIEPGILSELCGTQVNQASQTLPIYGPEITWQSTGAGITQDTLMPHAQHGYQAFNQLVANQYAQFDALVYSHAYQKTDAYQSLFFEVNKFQNVESYSDKVKGLSESPGKLNHLSGHNDFAYLVLSSGYHWGMMSVLAMLEEEFPNVHERKMQRAQEQVSELLGQLEMEQSSD